MAVAYDYEKDMLRRQAVMARMAKEVEKAKTATDKARFYSLELGWQGLQVPATLATCSTELTYVISQVAKAMS